MTIEQAIKILDPNTSENAITEIENLHGTDATDYVMGQIREACEVACKVMRQWLNDMVVIPQGEWIKDDKKSAKHIENIYYCSACEEWDAWGEDSKTKFCPECGAKMKNNYE